ncbi:MAG TPA: putative lipid II flippase FtsW [Salinisphaeraceae bacterium]|nr:putative lipid II flippase FtsW [Salinisphaeraceae bacterium]
MMILPAQLRLPRVMPDRTLLIALATLLFIGLVMVASSSIAEADRQIGNPLYYFNRQALYALLGLSAALAVVHVPMQYWQSNSFPLLGLGLFLLVLVLVPGIGDEVNGSRRWIGLGPISMQASEPARLCLLLYVAGYASRRQLALVSSWGGLLRPMLFMLLASGLLLMEPDYGGAAVLIAIAGMVLFLAGARLLPLVTLALGAVASLALLAMISPYRLQRLTSFTDPWADPFHTGFQLVQSLIAVGRGRIFGVGLGNSVQKLLYLPETHTDFLFAIYAEEFGLVGSLLIIGLFLLVLWRVFAIARRALERGQLFNGFVAYGLVGWLVLQAFINIGVNLGAFPTKGLTLPLLSYGGSSLVINLVLIGLLLRVDMESREPAQEGAT